nr:MAG TPA: structural protein [Caudoviricetes sp.]
MLKRYPFDPKGDSPDNLVRDEIHEILADKPEPIFYARNGAFYNDSLRVTLDGRPLTLNTDYQYCFYWSYASEASGHPVSLAIQIINKNLLGTVKLTYQVVGGEYIGYVTGLEELLKTLPLRNPNTFWDEILERPDAYFPMRHLHHVNDVFGLTKLVVVFDQIRAVLANQSALKLRAVYDRFLKLKQYVDERARQSDDVMKEVLARLAQIDDRLVEFVTHEEYSAGTGTILPSAPNSINPARLTELENELQTTKATLEANYESLKNVLLEQGVKIDDILPKLSSLPDMGEVEKRLDQIHTDMLNFLTRVNTVETIVSRVPEQVTYFSEKLEQNSAKVESLLSDVTTDLKPKVSGLSDSLTETGRRVGDLESKVRSNSLSLERVDELDGKLQGTSATVESLKERVKYLTGDERTNPSTEIPAIKQSIEAVNQRVTDLAIKVERKADAGTSQGSNTPAVTNPALESDVADLKRASTRHDERFKVLEANDSSREEKVRRNTEAVEGLRANVAELIKSDTATADLISKLSQSNAGVLSKVNTVEDKVSDNTAKVDQITRTISGYHERLTALEATGSGATGGKVTEEELNRKVVLLENRIATVSSKQVDLGSGFDTFKTSAVQRLEALENAKTTLSTNMDGYATRISDLEAKVVTINSEAGLKGDVKNLKSEQTTIKQRLDTLEANTELKGKVTTLESKVESLTTITNGLNTTIPEKLTELRQDVETLKQKAATTPGATTPAPTIPQVTQTELNALDVRVKVLENRPVPTVAQEVLTKVDELEVETGKLKTTTAKLVEGNASNLNKMATFESAINNVSSKVSALESKKAEATMDEAAVNKAVADKITELGLVATINQLQTNYTALDKKVTDNPLAGVVTATRNEVDRLTSLVSSQSGDISTHTTQIEGIQRTLNSANLASINSKMAKVDELINASGNTVSTASDNTFTGTNKFSKGIRFHDVMSPSISILSNEDGATYIRDTGTGATFRMERNRIKYSFLISGVPSSGTYDTKTIAWTSEVEAVDNRVNALETEVTDIKAAKKSIAYGSKFMDETNTQPINTTVKDNTLTLDGKFAAQAIKYTSDRRLKENLNVIEDPLVKLNKLTGYTFNYLNSSERSGGVIAQDVLSVLPDIVHVGADDHYNVEYAGVVALLVEAVKDLSNQVNHLNEELEMIKSKERD